MFSVISHSSSYWKNWKFNLSPVTICNGASTECKGLDNLMLVDNEINYVIFMKAFTLFQSKKLNAWASLQSSHFSEVDEFDLTFS